MGDLDSTGLLVFCKSGVIAKKLIHHRSKVEKEYLVDVQPAQQVTRRERNMDPTFLLPNPENSDDNIEALLQGGSTLLGDDRPLLPCREVKWIEPGQLLRVTLTE